MIQPTFLQDIAEIILKDYSGKLADTVIVLPNRRARVFLIEALKNQAETTIFAPNIVSIEDFVQEMADIHDVDSIALLFEFYQVYLQLTPNDPEPFETFANWAKTLLQDFNEIDRYLLDPDVILKYLENIKELEHWSLDLDKRTELIDKYLIFWKKLPLYYHEFYRHLLQRKLGYQGLIYREAVKNLNVFAHTNKTRFFLFAGFNALNHAEEKIVQHLLSVGQARIYWDLDETFLNDPFHDAGLFQRRFKSTWPYYKSHPYEWITNYYQQQKNIRVIGTPKSIGQAKIVGDIVRKHSEANGGNLQNTAVVLGEESLLLPILYALPDNVNALNITMGFSARNNPAQLLVAKLFKMHTNALSRNPVNYVFYYKDVLDILTHPLIEPYVGAGALVRQINQYNFTFIVHKKIGELHPEGNALFNLLFQKWDVHPSLILENLSEILLLIKSNLSKDNEEEKITNAFVYSVFKVINQLITYFSNHHEMVSVPMLYAIYKQVIDVAEVSFEGEPLNGLQVMGVLESRVLDFETVIITSVNEGKFPAGKSMNSFIPYDVKKEYGLPTYKEKDAIYTYHFYHLLQRAKNVYLLYNSDSEGMDAGERSRFIAQLEVEKQPEHQIDFQLYNPKVPEIAHEQLVVPKTDSVMERLREIADKGFSPSSLTNYIRNPIRFYFQRILRISETDEVEENIAVNTLGTIIHRTLEELYKPLAGKILVENDLTNCLGMIEAEVLRQFKEIYKEGEIKKGRNLLAFEVAKRHVKNFLEMELNALQEGDTIQIIALEVKLERELAHPSLPFPVKIAGNVDRIELRGKKGEITKIRIVDYKTGNVTKANMTLKQWNGLTEELKNDKIIQVLAYAFMYAPLAAGQEMEAGIISFKNLKSGFLPFGFRQDKTTTTLITQEILEKYQEELLVLLSEILNPDSPFKEKLI